MRLFIALDIPGETREAFAALIAKLRHKCPSAHWVRPEAMHITLKFIGHADPENLPAIHDALAKLRSPEPIEVHFRGLGFFPSEKRPRVFWCGVDASPNAAALSAAMDQALAKFGVEPENRPFTPHLTLARFKEGDAHPRGKHAKEAAEIVNVAHETQEKDFGTICTPEFHLFESKTKPTGAEYTRLETFHFAEAAN
ncbi:MAG TPA: RNA 2',3'-cyclic phosphodiesterase [Candidatus Acidoferrales bacterium]|nr:RNA 2',3'-cyclic phosphodiesterase [Candidatus Acidoferrales bacterium]